MRHIESSKVGSRSNVDLISYFYLLRSDIYCLGCAKKCYTFISLCVVIRSVTKTFCKFAIRPLNTSKRHVVFLRWLQAREICQPVCFPGLVPENKSNCDLVPKYILIYICWQISNSFSGIDASLFWHFEWELLIQTAAKCIRESWKDCVVKERSDN